MPTVLVMESDAQIRGSAERYLLHRGYSVESSSAIPASLGTGVTTTAHVALVEVDSDRNSRLHEIHLMRASIPTLAIIATSNVATVECQIDCFIAGAHTFVPRPYSLPLIAEQIASLVRLVTIREPDLQLRFSVSDRLLIAREAHVTLTRPEARILARLAQTPFQRVSKGDLAALWSERAVTPGTIRFHVSKLRSKLTPMGANEYLRGGRSGYALWCDVELVGQVRHGA